MKSICLMRDIYKALSDFENNFEKVHGVGLNEAMALCSIGDGTLSSTEISEKTGMSTSHTSKVIRSIEEKELIVRALGDKDKRQMYFNLSKKGKECLSEMKCGSVEIPELLKPIFEKFCQGD